MHLLIGNAFPFALFRAPASVMPISLDAARCLLARATSIRSFWGHENTLSVASAVLGLDLTPVRPRPALILDAHCLPGLDGQHTNTVLVLSSDFRSGYRPVIGTEATAADIIGWQCLLIRFSPAQHPADSTRSA